MPIEGIRPGQVFFHANNVAAVNHRWQNVRVENGVVVEMMMDDAPQPVNPARPPEKNGPELWQKLLDAVKEIFEVGFAGVAGGAVRDYLCGVDAKDIDIFVDLDKDMTIEELLEEADQLGWGKLQHRPSPYGEGGSTVFDAFVFGRPVQLICVGTDTLEEHLDTFDYYINQCWYDGEIHKTAKAAYGINKKVWEPIKELTDNLVTKFERVNKRVKGIYSLNRGEPWYQKFNPVPKGPKK
jgi:hypothetical protein